MNAAETLLQGLQKICILLSSCKSWKASGSRAPPIGTELTKNQRGSAARSTAGVVTR